MSCLFQTIITKTIFCILILEGEVVMTLIKCHRCCHRKSLDTGINDKFDSFIMALNYSGELNPQSL